MGGGVFVSTREERRLAGSHAALIPHLEQVSPNPGRGEAGVPHHRLQELVVGHAVSRGQVCLYVLTQELNTQAGAGLRTWTGSSA